MSSHPYAAMLWTQVLPTRGFAYTQDSEAAIGALAASVRATKGASTFEGPSIFVVEVPRPFCTYLFTRPGHFAHASVLIRKVVMARSGRVIEFSGATAAPDEVMEEWLAQFREGAEQVLKTYAGRR
jgi:hypothetical protein